MSTYDADVLAASMEVVQCLDGTYGKTWARVAEELDATAADGGRAYANPAALAGLIRALIDYGALR